MSLLQVPVNDLVRVLPFRANNDVRFYLNGICVEPHDDGCLLAATNGHWLAVMHSKAARVDKRRILTMSNDFEKALKRASDKRHDASVLVSDEGAHAILTSMSEGELYVEPGKSFIDGKFPEWRKVVPPIDKLAPGLVAPLQSKYISMLHKASTTQMYNGIKFWHTADNPDQGAVLARYGECAELVVVIMPLREISIGEWPSWMSTPAAVAVA